MKTQSPRLGAAACSILLACSFASAQHQSPVVVKETKHMKTAPLSEIAPKQFSSIERQRAETAPPVSTVGGLNFDGTKGTGTNYSDATGAAGATQYVQLTNMSYTIYNKSTGAAILAPVKENALWGTFGGPCQTSNNGDGTVMYDAAAGQWVFQHHAEPTGGPYMNCIAISATSDATGAYYLYAFNLAQNLPDQPKLGIWPDAYYLGQNLINPTTKSFTGGQACALDRTNMLLGNAATAICFQGSISLPSIWPVTWVGPTPPPAGAQEYFFQLDQRPGEGFSQVNEFLFHVDFVTPSNSTYTAVGSFAITPYKDTCFSACIPQLDTTNGIKPTGDRFMAPLVYRNFGDHESVLLTHSVSVGKTVGGQTGVRWYEIRTPLTPVIYQWGVIAPDTTYRFLPSIGMDQMGDIALGYSESSATIHPSIAYTGWQAGIDPLGQMEAETSVMTGVGSQQTGNTAWSNFGGMSIDPTDDCTFWYTNQYYAADSTNKWNTRVVSFKFPACSGNN